MVKKRNLTDFRLLRSALGVFFIPARSLSVSYVGGGLGASAGSMTVFCLLGVCNEKNVRGLPLLLVDVSVSYMIWTTPSFSSRFIASYAVVRGRNVSLHSFFLGTFLG